MTLIRSYEELMGCINHVRSLRKGFLTNFFPNEQKVRRWIAHQILYTIREEEAIIFVKKDDGFATVLFCATSKEALAACLKLLPQNELYVMHIVADKRTDPSLIESLSKAGFNSYKQLVRMSEINTGEEVTSSITDTENATVADVPRIEELLNEYFDKLAEQLPSREEIEDAVNLQHIIVKRNDNQIAGLIMYDLLPSTFHLRYWLVVNQYREQGIGSSLFKEINRRIANVRRHILWVMEDNENAIVRYMHYGYKMEDVKNYVLTFDNNKS